MAESAFNRKLREQLGHISIMVLRIESHATSPGCPDNHYLVKNHHGLSGWMEVKESDALHPSKVEYRPQQVPWLLDYSRYGGRCCTVLHIPKAEEMLFIHGRYAKAASISLDMCQLSRLSLRDDTCWSQLSQLLRKA